MTVILLSIFGCGYLLITLEHQVRISKAATALVTGMLSWLAYMIISGESDLVNAQLEHHLVEISGIVFFLLGAMVIVELIDLHEGFELIADRINLKNKTSLLWTIGFLTFFLSAFLDNLTTTIVMGSLLRKILAAEKDRMTFLGMVVIAANAGGAWSPIGDVTSTMLWIGGQISSATLVQSLILPSLVCLCVPLFLLSFSEKGVITKPEKDSTLDKASVKPSHRYLVLVSGILALAMVPLIKNFTNLPPYVAMLFGLGVVWIITELLHVKKAEEQKQRLSVAQALEKSDMPSILFFFGILCSVAALESTGVLSVCANWLSAQLPDERIVALSLGTVSAVVDNVPLVAAAQGMFSLEQYPNDHPFWLMLAYASGTGGSMLIIGSAAGVAAMGIEKLNFFWYLKKMSLLAVLGFVSGALVFVLQSAL